jgi:hypothetical protein
VWENKRQERKEGEKSWGAGRGDKTERVGGHPPPIINKGRLRVWAGDRPGHTERQESKGLMEREERE